MTTGTMEAAADDIRVLIESLLQAARDKEPDRIMAHYAPDIRAFDAVTAVQFKGSDVYRKHWEACLDMCQGPMILEAHDLDIAVEGDLAFCHYLVHCSGTNDDGEEETGWMRATTCWRRTGGEWRIVHEHHSAPFDMASGKALTDLTP